MKTPLQQNRDFLAGMLFLLIGGIGFYVALGYSFGNLQRMGPGYFPRILSGVLIASQKQLPHCPEQHDIHTGKRRRETLRQEGGRLVQTIMCDQG